QSELANRKRRSLCHLYAKSAAMIRIDTIWFANEPMEMLAGTDTAMARVLTRVSTPKPNFR
ncbi:hypothetical protein, partial [Pseudomonas syringae group genomosp. 7]|uniref:hypothetical protein n=1 Tax=Pseudomonas syringae group genomosp. 7 TaxID=251699 RepID=UPI00376FB3D5